MISMKKYISGLFVIAFIGNVYGMRQTAGSSHRVYQQRMVQGLFAVTAAASPTFPQQPDSRIKKCKFKKPKTYLGSKRPLSGPADGRRYHKTHDSHSDLKGPEVMFDEHETLEDDPQVAQCVARVGEAYFGSKLFSKRLKKNVPPLLNKLEQWLLVMKYNPSLWTRDGFKRGIKNFLPLALVREAMHTGAGSACLLSLSERVAFFLSSFSGNSEEIAPFVSETIIALMRKFGTQQKQSRNPVFASGKQSRLMQEAMKEEKEVYFYGEILEEEDESMGDERAMFEQQNKREKRKRYKHNLAERRERAGESRQAVIDEKFKQIKIEDEKELIRRLAREARADVPTIERLKTKKITKAVGRAMKERSFSCENDDDEVSCSII
jgi:hypothetical protein